MLHMSSIQPESLNRQTNTHRINMKQMMCFILVILRQMTLRSSAQTGLDHCRPVAAH